MLKDGGFEIRETITTVTPGGRTRMSVGKPHRGLIKAFGVGSRARVGCVLSKSALAPG